MSKKANIKLDSSFLNELVLSTGEKTGKKAVEKAIVYYIQEARQRDMVNFLKKPRFKKDYNIIKLRQNER